MYIRTKDGIYKVVTAERGSDNKLLYIISTSKTENTTDWVHEADVISQSENLEELCDEFVVWLDENNCHFTTTNYLYIYQNRDKAKATFGAIWCEWGLKYVAKLDDKGDLVLI